MSCFQNSAPVHFAHASAREKQEAELQLAYSEGCYGGLPTLYVYYNYAILRTIQYCLKPCYVRY